MEAGQVALPEGFIIDGGDDRLAMQDDLARAADRATAEKRNPAKDSEVLALQAKLYKAPLFGKSSNGLPEGFEVDAPAKAEAKSDGNPFLDAITTANKAAGYLNPASLLTDAEKQQVLHDNPVATAYRFIASKAKLADAVNALRAPDEDGVTPIEREIARRKAAGESIAPRDVEQWVDTEAKRKVFGAPPAESPPVTEQLKQLYQSAVNEPAKFARSFIVGSIAHPEYLMLGPIGGIAAITGESVMEQEGEHGQVDANKLMTDVATAGIPVVALHGAVRLGNLRAAKTTGAEPTAKVEEQALTAINEKVKEGISEGQAPQAAAAAALDDVLAVMKIAPDERAAIVKGTEDAIGEGQQQKGGEPEHPGVAVERPQAESSSGDRPVDSAQAQVEPRPVDRRQDAARRAAVADMSPDEMRQALLTDALTGLPNRRAYIEAPKRPITSSIDVDGLKWVNDNLGHEAGDQLLKAVGGALDHVEGYHLSGDEFVAQFDHPDAAKAGMAEFQRKLNNISLEFTTPDGKTVSINGIGASHGIGDSVSTADAALRASKLSREATGERKARGEQPPSVTGPDRFARSADSGPPAGEPLQAGGGQAGRVNLADIKPEIGWAEAGGHIIRDPATGDVVGRTTWIPKSEFWQDRPGPTKISERAAHEAIKKAQAGEKLTPKEQRFVDYAKEELGKRNREAFDAERQRALDAADAQRRAVEDARLSAHEAAEERLGIQEFGRVDPKLLAAMGIAGVGAAYGYWLNKDPAESVRGALIAGGVAAGALALGKVYRATGGLLGGLKDTRYRIGHLTDDYSGAVKVGEWGTYRLQKSMDALVPRLADRTRILHAYQAGEVSRLSPVEQEYAKILGKGFERGAEMSKATGSPIQSLLENYITQFWVKGLNTKASLMENLKRAMDASGQTSPGMSPNVRFAKQRVIPNYKAGIEAGLVPVTLDPSAILRMYLDNINRAVQNKKLIDALGREKNPLGEQMVVKGDVLDSEVKRRALEAMEGTPLDGPAKRMVADVEAIKAPSDYVFINHPQMRNVKVHPDVAAPLKALFDSNDANAATRAAYAVSIAAKRGLFSFSLFHVRTLLDALLGASPAAWPKVPGALKMLRDGENAGLRDLIHGGLNVVTRPLEADASAFANGMRVLEAKLPMAAMPIKGVRWMQEHVDHFLWGVVHPSFKIAAGLAAYEKQIVKRPDVPRAQIAKEVASYANDIFGGLDWFKIADGVQNRYGRDLALALASPSGKRFMQIAMLAPDWTVATTRAMAKAIPGVSAPAIASMHRGYVLRSALVYLMVADGLNQAFSGHHLWDNRDPTMVDMGDGRRMQLSKHFMEPVHWLTKPGQQLLNKLGYVVKEPLDQAMNVKYLSTTGSPTITDKLDSTFEAVGKRLGHAVKSASPIPYSVATESGLGPALSGSVGLPILGKTQEQAIDAAIERALNLREKQLQSDDPADKAKGRRRSDTETAAAARDRVNRQYQKQRDEQRKREAR